ncbi:MAG: pilus assembly protein TadG-related protein [Sphingomicrobium sp.]
MISFFKRLHQDRRGNVLVIAAAAMPLLVGSAGLATDTIQWTLWKRELQRAADSAAIAGVYTRVQTNTQTAVEAAVSTDLTINNHSFAAMKSGYPTVELLNDSGAQQKIVRVTLKAEKRLPFSSMFLASTPTIRATATAASIPGAAEYCVVALDPSASAIGIDITGSTTLDMGDCSLIANSRNPNQAASNGGGNNNTSSNNSSVTAHSLAAAGGVQESANWHVDSYDPYSTPVADPFASKGVPACTKTVTDNRNFVNNGSNQTPNIERLDGSVSVNRSSVDGAGDVVCIRNTKNNQTGLNISSGSTVVLGSATYVIDGGDLGMNSSNSGTSLSCTGCTIILTNSADPTQTGTFKLTGGTLNLSAPTTDTSTNDAYNFKGIALMQDRRAVDTKPSSPANTIVGNNGASVTGAVYIPNQGVKYSGGSSTNSACLQIVALRTTFTGNSKMTVSNACASAGISPIGSGSDSGRKVRLIA